MPKIKTTKSKKYGVEVPPGKEGKQWYAEVPVDSIQPHPENPNKGDVAMIQESIQENDFYGACVVQASSGRILAGEHRWRAARAEGLEELPVIFRDCDDHTALRILLVDNESARRGEVDPEVVEGILGTLTSVEDDGALDRTGFDLDWLEDREAEREAAAEAEANEVKAGKAAEVDDSDLDTQFAVIVMLETEKEQEAAFEKLSEIYGAKSLRAVSV